MAPDDVTAKVGGGGMGEDGDGITENQPRVVTDPNREERLTAIRER